MAVDWRQTAAIMTRRMEGATVIVAVAARRRRLNEHLAARFISRTARLLALRALLLFDQARQDMADISIEMVTGLAANNSIAQSRT